MLSSVIDYAKHTRRMSFFKTFSLSQMSKGKACFYFAMARKGARKRTFSLSQMSKGKLAFTLPWREIAL